MRTVLALGRCFSIGKTHRNSGAVLALARNDRGPMKKLQTTFGRFDLLSTGNVQRLVGGALHGESLNRQIIQRGFSAMTKKHGTNDHRVVSSDML
jgi:hypothetical protein